MSADASFTAAPRFRQRKISLKQQLRIIWQKDLPENAEDVRGDLLGVIETGVDKNEEDERHLQAVLHASTVSGKAKDAFIPTPKASTKWEEYHKYYKPGWTETESYIRSSATVEDAEGNAYNMDEEDLDYLNSMNSKISDERSKCTEDEFEMICSLIETVVAEKQPFLSTDPEQLLSYEELEKHVLKKLEDQRQALKDPMNPEKLLLEANSPDYAPKLVGCSHRSWEASVKTFGSTIYQHWRKRKIARHGQSIFPSLKFESGLASDDTDPYVCFRRREVRHSRKTRRTDQQNSGRLRKLHSEMYEAQSIFELILKRERTRLKQIQTDFEMFEMRCRVKALKRKLKIGAEPDDVQLLVSVPKRVRLEEQARLRREEAEKQRKAQLAKEKQERDRERKEAQREAQREAARESRSASAAAASGSAAEARKPAVPVASGSRIPDLEHVTIEQQLADRERAIKELVAEKMRAYREADAGWINSTDDSRVPFHDFFHNALLSPPPSEENSEHNSDLESSEKPSISSSSLNSKTKFDKMDIDEYVSLKYDPERAKKSDSEPSREHPRLQLPMDSMDENDSPEIFEFSDVASEPAMKYNDIDFLRNPQQFSIPLDVPQVFCRRRTFGSLTYVDRVLPPNANPLFRFREKLSRSESAEDERLLDRFKFDQESDDFTDDVDMLRNDPARLNGISPTTQNLRFSAMLTAKAGEILAEAQVQRRRAIQAMIKRQQMQQQQRALQDAQAQQNAQAQMQSNLRMQQSQRAMQRQQQRKKPVVQSSDAGNANAKPPAKDGGKQAPSQQQQQQQPKSNAKSNDESTASEQPAPKAAVGGAGAGAAAAATGNSKNKIQTANNNQAGPAANSKNAAASSATSTPGTGAYQLPSPNNDMADDPKWKQSQQSSVKLSKSNSVVDENRPEVSGDKSNDKGKGKDASFDTSSGNADGGGHNGSRITPQPPKVEASV